MLIITGCASAPERPNSTACSETSSSSSDCSNSSFIFLKSENGQTDTAIAFVEFNDEGRPFDQSITDAAINNIEQLNAADDKSLLIVTFIHGWNHNAAQTDSNVMEFKKFLRTLQKEEATLEVGTPRKVVGLYVGWQGKSSENSILRLFSYREKKELALKTGEQSVTDVLKKLSIIRVSDSKNRLILVGHSFGGALLYSSVKKDLLEQLNQNTQSVKLFGDLVVLMNPAIEANRLTTVHETLNKSFQECTPLSMVSFTSEADTALSQEFPRGMRIFYADQLKDNANNDLLTTAYGRYDSFSKYELRPDDINTIDGVLTKEVFSAAVPSWEKFRSGQAVFNLGGIKLSNKASQQPVAAWEPVLNVIVDKSLIQEHNEIWDPKFQYFLRGLIGMQFAKARQCR
jgi:hypothetical protein